MNHELNLPQTLTRDSSDILADERRNLGLKRALRYSQVDLHFALSEDMIKNK